MKVLVRGAMVLGLVINGLLVGPVQGKDPTAAEIMDRFVEVTGGKAAYEKVKNRKATGTMEIPAAGLKGSVTMWHAEPNRMYMEVDLQGIGKIEEGTDGNIVWEINAMTGPRIKKGEERANALREADFNSDLHWRKIYPSAKLDEGEENIDGKPAYKVVLTTPEGHVRTNYYDKASGLLVKTEAKEQTNMGEMDAESTISDYRKVDGILTPFTIHQKVGPQGVVIKLDKVEDNVDIPANRFDIPESVKKLAEKEKAGKKQEEPADKK